MATRFLLARGSAAALLLASMLTDAAEAASASASYTYDQLGRVTTALYDNGTCVAYSYDPSGNRTAQANTSSGAPETATWGAGTWGCAQWTAALSGALTGPAARGASLALAALEAAAPGGIDKGRRSARAELIAQGDGQ